MPHTLETLPLELIVNIASNFTIKELKDLSQRYRVFSHDQVRERLFEEVSIHPGRETMSLFMPRLPDWNLDKLKSIAEHLTWNAATRKVVIQLWDHTGISSTNTSGLGLARPSTWDSVSIMLQSCFPRVSDITLVLLPRKSISIQTPSERQLYRTTLLVYLIKSYNRVLQGRKMSANANDGLQLTIKGVTFDILSPTTLRAEDTYSLLPNLWQELCCDFVKGLNIVLSCSSGPRQDSFLSQAGFTLGSLLRASSTLVSLSIQHDECWGASPYMDFGSIKLPRLKTLSLAMMEICNGADIDFVTNCLDLERLCLQRVTILYLMRTAEPCFESHVSGLRSLPCIDQEYSYWVLETSWSHVFRSFQNKLQKLKRFEFSASSPTKEQDGNPPQSVSSHLDASSYQIGLGDERRPAHEDDWNLQGLNAIGWTGHEFSEDLTSLSWDMVHGRQRNTKKLDEKLEALKDDFQQQRLSMYESMSEQINNDLCESMDDFQQGLRNGREQGLNEDDADELQDMYDGVPDCRVEDIRSSEDETKLCFAIDISASLFARFVQSSYHIYKVIDSDATTTYFEDHDFEGDLERLKEEESMAEQNSKIEFRFGPTAEQWKDDQRAFLELQETVRERREQSYATR